MPVDPALRLLRQEDCYESQVIVNYRVRLYEGYEREGEREGQGGLERNAEAEFRGTAIGYRLSPQGMQMS